MPSGNCTAGPCLGGMYACCAAGGGRWGPHSRAAPDPPALRLEQDRGTSLIPTREEFPEPWAWPLRSSPPFLHCAAAWLGRVCSRRYLPAASRGRLERGAPRAGRRPGGPLSCACVCSRQSIRPPPLTARRRHADQASGRSFLFARAGHVSTHPLTRASLDRQCASRQINPTRPAPIQLRGGFAGAAAFRPRHTASAPMWPFCP